MQRNPLRLRAIAVVGLLVAVTSLPAAAGLYRWVDSQGRVHYGDQIPPDASKHGGAEISDTGRQLKDFPAQKTPEQIKAEQEAARKQAAEEREKRRQETRDRVLLQTFNSEQDIITARNRKLGAVQGAIRITKGRLDGLEQQLAARRAEAANIERSGRVVSKQLANGIKTLEGQVAENKRFLADKAQEIDKINAQAEADIKRYRELTTPTSDPGGDGTK